MGAAGDRTLPVPAGYPANLPIPVMTSDGKLLLRPVVKKYLSSQEILWIQKALQPLIIQYSPTPYNIYWSVKGWGSGAGNIQVATSPLDLGTHNFLEYPRQPSGFDKVLIGLNDVLPALVGYAANIVVPGSGSFVSNAISSQTSSAKETNTSMELSPSQLQNAQQQPPSTGLLSAGVSIGPLLMIAGAGLFILSSNKR
jgi:hypothetical protein